MKKLLQSKGGYTGIDVAVAIVILFVFTAMISTIFINIYLQFSESQRSSVATAYATQISELVDKMYYQDVNVETLQERISGMNISNGYTVLTQVERYIPEGYTAENSKELIKTVKISVSYKVGNSTKSVEIQKIKAKEILITPNKPKLSSGMVPVKYVVTDIILGEGYWQITTENDPTWYNYENKVWANMMLVDGLIVEGNIAVTEENIENLVGKRITTVSPTFAWIPKYAYNSETNDVVFIYSTSNNIVNSQGYLDEINSGFSINNAFDGKTGFWIANSDFESIVHEFTGSTIVGNMSANEGEAVINLSQSKYGTNSTQWSNLTDSRFIITVN